MTIIAYTGTDRDGKPLSTEALQRDFYINGVNWFGTRESGFIHNVGLIQERIEVLNKNIKEASESSEKLSAAVHKLTKYGTIIAGIGLFVAVISFGFEVYRYFR